MAARPEGRMIRQAARYWLAPVAWMAAIFVVSSVPGEKIPSVFPAQDILFHGVSYGILGLLFYRALKFSCPAPRGAGLIALAAFLAVLYGISDEFHQSFISGRNASLFDVAVDFAGALIGSAFAHLISPWLR